MKKFSIFCLVLLWAFVLHAENKVDLEGQLLLWGAVQGDEEDIGRHGIRYLPGLKTGDSITDALDWDAQVSAALVQKYGSGTGEVYRSEGEVQTHRLWGRLYSDSLEVRLGLQKINFGPGKTLRVLQWFDQLDSQDPTGFTEGVKGLLLRNYFSNDANLWGWALYQNEGLKGNSAYPTFEDHGEWGGRFQYPLGNAELALSIHSRDIDISRPNGKKKYGIEQEPLAENRLGWDLSWDLGVGIWMEGEVTRVHKNSHVPSQKRQTVLGFDYTADMGNGFYTALELLEVEVKKNVETHVNENSLTLAFTQSYPLTLLDQIRFIEFWETERDIATFFGSWQRTYDDWLLSTAITWETEDPDAIDQPEPRRQLQLWIQYNH